MCPPRTQPLCSCFWKPCLPALGTMERCTAQTLQCPLLKAPLLPNQEILNEGCPSLPGSTLTEKKGGAAGEQTMESAWATPSPGAQATHTQICTQVHSHRHLSHTHSHMFTHRCPAHTPRVTHSCHAHRHVSTHALSHAHAGMHTHVHTYVLLAHLHSQTFLPWEPPHSAACMSHAPTHAHDTAPSHSSYSACLVAFTLFGGLPWGHYQMAPRSLFLAPPGSLRPGLST